jgi:hypothetical protein
MICSLFESSIFFLQAAAHISAWNGLAFQTQKAKLTKVVATSLTSVKAAVGGPLKGMQTSLKAMVTKLRTGKEVSTSSCRSTLLKSLLSVVLSWGKGKLRRMAYILKYWAPKVDMTGPNLRALMGVSAEWSTLPDCCVKS